MLPILCVLWVVAGIEGVSGPLNHNHHSDSVVVIVMPPLEDMSAKVLPGLLTEPIEIDGLVVKGMSDEDDVMEHVAAIRLQECTLSTDDFMMEPRTGSKFPMSLSPVGYKEGLNDNSFNQVLAGVGVRSVSFIRLSLLKIYAFGFYVKPQCLRTQLGAKYGGVPPEELKFQSSFYEDVLRHELDMTVRLIVHHKRVRIGLVKSTFETALRNRLKKMKSNDDEGLQVFGSYFAEDLSLPAGTVIDFHWQPGGQFHTKVGDRFMGTIRSLDFCRAFFDIYIGEPPVCHKAKQDIGLRLGHMLCDCS
ncbi:hypothetical protein GOP47_0016603 [Adiantum capillus-veneris]|uniref:Chalcone isomerase domain-containing protein n=1 Tax=Adiantum capillus-veneris TaxID=13818 RepID=A0A9D4ZAG1_ADICA|nr:hypothetical protein GOP47_0016603 [Adiantum capillus-veneris]